MDIIMVLIDDSVKIGDKVTIIGKFVDIKYIANYLDTIEYEVLCEISDRVPRIYIKNDKIINKKCLRFK